MKRKGIKSKGRKKKKKKIRKLSTFRITSKSKNKKRKPKKKRVVIDSSDSDSTHDSSSSSTSSDVVYIKTVKKRKKKFKKPPKKFSTKNMKNFFNFRKPAKPRKNDNIEWKDKHISLINRELEKIKCIKTIKNFMIDFYKKQPTKYFLFITAPSGTLVKELIVKYSKELKTNVVEFSELYNVRFSQIKTRLDVSNVDTPRIVYDSPMKTLRKFLSDANLSKHIIKRKYKRSLFIVEELPQIYNKEQLMERSKILFEALLNAKHNLIIIIHTVYEFQTLEKSLFHNFSKEFLCSSNLFRVNIKLSKWVSEKLIKRVLESILSRERRRIKSSELLKISELAKGDLAHAIYQIQFQSLKFSNKKKKKKKSAAPPDFMESYGSSFQKNEGKMQIKDQRLTIYHFAGKILHSKRDPKTNKLENDLNKMYINLTSTPSTLLSYLHENYDDYCYKIDEISKLMDSFSFSDLMGKKHEKNFMFNFKTDYSYMNIALSFAAIIKNRKKRGFLSIDSPLSRTCEMENRKNMINGLCLFNKFPFIIPKEELFCDFLPLFEEFNQKNNLFSFIGSSLENESYESVKKKESYLSNGLRKYRFRGERNFFVRPLRRKKGEKSNLFYKNYITRKEEESFFDIDNNKFYYDDSLNISDFSDDENK